ncbi:restriction endonuclease subunit S [Polaromonas sp.]|uniref:restriction endonuclease subunit S n=1 Tax=Polaromonas sp. TaxID=1869339 RepID=UPI003565A7CF
MLLSNLNLLTTAPDGVAKLRELILTLAVQGKLVPQDPSDEPASVLLKKIRAEKDRLIAEGKIKRDRPLAEIAEDEKPFELPKEWEWVKFGDVALISSGITLGRKTPIASATLLPYLRVANVQRWHLNLTSMKQVVIDRSELERFQLCDGDLLITEGGDWDKVGRTAVWRSELTICLHQNHVFKARGTSGDWNPIWAELYLNSPVARSYFASAAKQTTNLASINMTQLKNCVFPVPPLAEQSRIVTRVEELMRLCDALQAKARLEATQHAQLVGTLLSALTASTTPEELTDNWHRVATLFDLLLDRPEAVDALEQTILQLAVRGLLVPQDPKDEPASALLQKIRIEKDHLIAQGKIKRDKPLPPVAEDEKPFELPPDWEWVRLDAMCSVITDGDHLPPPVAPVGIAFLTIGNISSGKLNFEGCRLVPPEYFDAIAEYRRPAKGDVLYTVVGASYGRPVIVETDRPFCVQRHIGILKPAMGISLPYLGFLLASQFMYGQATRSLTGTAQPTVGLRLLRNFPAPLPPLAEQSRIVARVASLRALCADLRQRLTTARTQQVLLAQVLVENSV